MDTRTFLSGIQLPSDIKVYTEPKPQPQQIVVQQEGPPTENPSQGTVPAPIDNSAIPSPTPTPPKAIPQPPKIPTGISRSTNPADFGGQFVGNKKIQNYMTTIKLKNGKSVTVNKEVANNFKGFLDELWDRGYHYSNVGGYSLRHTQTPRGTGSKWSRHSMGLAIDIDGSKNQFKGRGYTGTLPKWAGDLAKKYNLVWGADFGDSMHFSYRDVKLKNVAGG